MLLIVLRFNFTYAQIQGKFWFGGTGAYLNYKEKEEGRVLDKDYGWLPGFEGGFLLSERNWMLKIAGRWASGDATYDGQTQGGTPLKFDEDETIFSVELNYGYTIQSFINITPYVGIGYRKWTRGEAQLVELGDNNYATDYKEVYKWGYVPIGMIFEIDFLNSKFKVGLDAAVLLPFDMKMTAYLSEISDYPDLDFDLGWHVGGKCEVPITFYVKPKTALYITPFYRYWNIGKSDIVLAYSPTQGWAYFHEPHSITHFYGVTCGVIFDF